MTKFSKLAPYIIGVLFLLSCVAFAVETGLPGNDQHIFDVYRRHHHFDAGAVVLGPTAPGFDLTGTAGCLAFDNDNEVVYLTMEVAEEWIGVSDFELDIDWHPEDGDPIAQGETVKFDISWHSIEYGEAIDDGTVATGTDTYTEASNPGIDKESIDGMIPIPYTGGNQSLALGDNIYIEFSRDMTGDTYGGDAVVCDWYMNFDANKLATF